jgi:hypothetical protein
MIKYIRAFYKTVKESGKDAEYLLHTVSSFIGYIIFGGVYEATKNDYIGYITIFFATIGTYFLVRFMYIMLIDDLKDFFKKVKNNIK